MTDMRIKDLKQIIDKLPDDMLVVIPVIDEESVDRIYGFRKVRTAGILTCEAEQDPEVLCLNAATNDYDIADQVHFSGRDVDVVKVLFGESKKEKQNDQN